MVKKTYQPLTIPRITWVKETLRNNYGELIAQPLEPGFGITLGNALRRILLGGVEGSAVTAVFIKGVNNEFSSLEGVVEDTMQVILNIKELVIKNNTGLPGKMKLSIKGESVVKASDIEADEHIEIINKDHIIAHVAKDGDLSIEFFVESGRGYLPAQWPEDVSTEQDNKIFVDAMFSPVKSVTFDVEKTRVGAEIDFDKLILQVTTDGSETPVEVLNYAVSVLRSQLEHFLISPEIPFNAISHIPEQEKTEVAPIVEDSPLKGLPIDLLLKPIDELELSVRAHNCLISAGINRILDLVNLTEDEALKIKNFGRKSLNEVRDNLKAFGFHYGMNIKEADVKRMIENKGS